MGVHSTGVMCAAPQNALTAGDRHIISRHDMNPRPHAARSAADTGDADIDYRALAELRYQIRCFLTFSEGQARAARLQPQQHQLLLALKGLPPAQRPTISVLAERLQLKHHTLVGLLDRLVDAQLAARRASTSDRREILVEITPKGERLLRSLSLAHRNELRNKGPALLLALQRILTSPSKTRRRA
jgi:DNA-binding MarR family transcriptional regulator